MFQLQSANLIVSKEIQQLDIYADDTSATVDEVFDNINKLVEKQRNEVLTDVKKKKDEKRKVLENQLQMLKVIVLYVLPNKQFQTANFKVLVPGREVQFKC